MLYLKKKIKQRNDIVFVPGEMKRRHLELFSFLRTGGFDLLSSTESTESSRELGRIHRVISNFNIFHACLVSGVGMDAVVWTLVSTKSLSE